MEIKIINNHNAFLNLKNDWEILQNEANNITFYSTFEYQYNYYKINYESTSEPCIICVYKNKRIIGIAPFIKIKKSNLLFRIEILKFIGNADFMNIIISKEFTEQTILKKIFDVLKKMNCDVMELTHISHDTPLAHFFFKSELYNNDFHPLEENPYLKIEDYDCFEDYKKKFFKGKFNYYQNKLKKDYQAYTEVVTGDCELKNISAIHKIRNLKGRTNLFENHKNLSLITELYKNKENTFTFLLKTKDGELMSYVTCYYYKGVLHNWNTSFNPKYKDYSIGDIIYYEMISYAFENKEKIKKIDFGTGGYPWKFRMTSTFTKNYMLQSINKKSKVYLLMLIYYKIVNLYKVLILDYQVVSK